MTLAAVPGEPAVALPLDDAALADMMQYANVFWHYQEHGTFPPNASLPDFSQYGDNADLFLPAFRVFEAYYSDQLDNDALSPTHYTIHDLLDDDPTVLAQFRHFTLTTELASDLGTLPEAARHIEFVNAGAASDSHTVEATSLDVGQPPSMQSTALISEVEVAAKPEIKKPAPEQEPDPDAPGDAWPDRAPCPPPELDQDGNCIDDRLDEAIDSYPDALQLGFENIDDQHPSLWPVPQRYRPGIDCDDFADIFAEHLRRQFEGTDLEDAIIKQLWLTWSGDGHVVTMIIIDGKYYVIDPKNPGSIKGPYSSQDDAIRAAWKLYDVLFERSDDYEGKRADPRDPGWRPWNEPAPWYEDEGRREDFERNTRPPDGSPGLDPLDYIPPDKQ